MKKTLSILIVFLVLFSFTSVVFAGELENSKRTFNSQIISKDDFETYEHIEFSKDPRKPLTEEEAEAIARGGIPSVTTEQVSSYIDKKGFEIVAILQKAVQPFSVIIFIGCALLTLVGAFGNGSLVGKGIVGMMIACIMYAVVLYAPELLDFFLAWVRE